MRPLCVSRAILNIEGFQSGLLRMTMRACCMSSVLTCLFRIVRELFQVTPIALPSETFVVGASVFLYRANVRLSHSVSRILVWALPVCHSVTWRELESHS